MKKTIILLAALTVIGSINAKELKSPDRTISVTVTDTTILVSKNGHAVQTIFVDMPGKKQGRIRHHHKERYEMSSGKRRLCMNMSNDCTYISGSDTLVIKAFNDGVAYRISANGSSAIPRQEFIIPDGTRRWMQTLKTDYEGFYPMSTQGHGGSIGYPALIQYDDRLFGLIAESDVSHGQSGSHLDWNVGRSSYSVTNTGNPESHMTPWRVLVLGSLSTIVESTLVTDLAHPSMIEDTSWIKPGVSAWIYWADRKSVV